VQGAEVEEGPMLRGRDPSETETPPRYGRAVGYDTPPRTPKTPSPIPPLWSPSSRPQRREPNGHVDELAYLGET